jgi:hypothetical protein
MDPRQELEELRRLDELERRAGATVSSAQDAVASEYGPYDAAKVAAGRTLDRLYQGVKQSALQIPAAFGSQSARDALDAQAKEEAYRTGAFQALEKQRPMATMVGGAAPLLAAPMLGAGMAGMAASAALPGLVEYGTPQERLTRGAVGGVGGMVGAGLAKGAERLLRPVQMVPDAARTAAVQAAQRIGYEAPIGQQTGSRTLQAVEQELGKNPFSAGGAQTMNNANQAAVNRAYARSIGENAPSITDDVLSAAKARIGGQFDAIAGRNTINVAESPLLNALVKLDSEQQALGSFADDSVRALVDKGLDLASRKQVDGKTYQIIRSELGRKAESALNGGNSTLGLALKDVQRALDEAANSSISAADQAAWKLARSQWQALKLASKRNGVIEGGNVSAARLATKVDKARGPVPREIADIAKIGETFKPLPDSGTASNAMTQALISGGAGLLGPLPLATSVAAPMLTQKFLRSAAGQKYLSEGLANLSPEWRRLLELSGAGLLSAPATYAQ